jgi:arylsulfatase A-like enzyme
MGRQQRAVTDGRWKLIRYPEIGFTQLFDLASDPHELVNLAARAEQSQRVEALRRRLEAWQARLGDDVPWTASEVRPREVDLTGRPRTPDRWQPPWIVEKYFGD